MTNEEIRIKIAQAKGCHWYEVRGSAYLCSDSSRMMIDREAVRVDEPDPDSKLHFKVPNWPENIADAWELFEEMPAPKVVRAYRKLKGNEIAYECGCAGETDFDGDDYYPYDASDDTAPLTICAAWLSWDAARKAEK